MRFPAPTARTRRGSRRPVAQLLSLAVLASALVVLAVSYDGAPVRDVELNDGSVWVTNANRGLLGRLNSQVEELDLALATSPTSDTVFQQGASVQVVDDGGASGATGRSVTVVDVVSGTTMVVPVEGDVMAAAGASTVALTDRRTGRTWIRESETLEGFQLSEPPDVVVPDRSQVVVTRSGTALVANRRTGKVTAWRFDETGRPVAGDTWDLGAELVDDAELSAVGETPVMLQAGKLYRPGEDPVSTTGDSAVLQQVGPDAADVYVATDRGLWRTGVSGGDLDQASTVDGGGAPAAPVVVGRCVHAAWNRSDGDNYERICTGGTDEAGGAEESRTGQVKGLNDASELVFRTNRDVVVLNDIVNGTSWLVQEPGLTRVDDWDSVDPNVADPQVADADDESTSQKKNTPPTAVEDEFGARPGSTVVLPVTLNDIDADGDVLVLTGPPAAQDDASFSLVGDGTQVQARLGSNASGKVSFEYEISDGQPGNPPSAAKVTLKIYDQTTDKQPKRLEDQETRLVVADGYQASTNVLPAWIDPEGDAVVLTDVSSEDGTVGFRPDGTIDFTDDGQGPGEETVEYTLRGGKETVTSELEVSVVDPEEAEPTTVADHFEGTVGTSILLEPLGNDIEPLGEELALSSVRKVTSAPARILTDDVRGTAVFQADRPGAYYLTYEATASNGVPGTARPVRVDVAPARRDNRPPVATRDVAAVRPGSSMLVDVLANDTDPDGDVMVVQGVRVPAAAAGVVKASLINKRFVRVELRAALEDKEPILEYLLSDGKSDQVTGAITVTSADTSINRAPVALEDQVTARAGTIVTVPVLDNDKDPDGDRLSVNQTDLFDVGSEKIVAKGSVPIVADARVIRVLVPDDGRSQVLFGYGVRDTQQARTDSQVLINVLPDDPDLNSAPKPQPLEERTVTGQQIRVNVDTVGADPDGDPVVFNGILSPPRLGRILASGANWFDYVPLDAGDATGTDTFKIQVGDQYGLTGVAEVRIGVAAPAQENQAPSALDDDLLVKPGLTVQYPVLNNDSDPDGDPLILTADDLSLSAGTQAKLVDQSVEMQLPEVSDGGAKAQAVQYEVSDGLGGIATAVLTVTADPDAPDYAPVTQDDVVTVDQLRDKATGDTVDVDVLANDGDVDGARSDLQLEAFEPKSSSVEGGKLRLTLRDDNQVVPYRVSDATGQSSFGFVYVSGTQVMPPMLDPTSVPLEVEAGDTLSVSLDDVVVVRPGRRPRFGNTTLIEEANGDVEVRGKDSFDFRAPPDFNGTASVTAPVIDGESLQDPSGLESQITIPITVLPSENVAPEARDTAVTVFAGADPSAIQLDRLATDANPGDELEFTASGESGGVRVSQSDDVLSIGAESDAPSGEVTLTVEVSDGDESAEASIRVSVVGSDPADAAGDEPEQAREPMTLRDLTIPDAKSGQPEVIDVTQAILFDPYPESEKKILSASGSGADVASEGTRLTVTPRDSGTSTVTYRIDDGSGEPARAVEGRVVVTAATKPSAPSAPDVESEQPDTVILSWRAPDDGGSPITGYEVQTDTGKTQACPQTRCTFGGLDSGSTYRFRVKAENAVGPSDYGPYSAPVTPDVVPGRMAAPSVVQDYKDRDGKLSITFRPPENQGSAITGYVVETSPRTRPRDVPASARKYTVDGLKNGASYQFSIRAVNDKGDGPDSPLSQGDTPFTTPGKMAAPTLKATNDDGKAGGFLEVSWPALESPGNGDDQITNYTVRLNRDGKLLTEKGTDKTGLSFTVENGHTYTAQVRATNRAGTSDYSEKSAEQVSWDKAKAVTAISNASDCPNAKCSASTSSYVGKVSFTSPQDNGGYPVTGYRWSTGAKSGTVSDSSPSEGASESFDIAFSSKSTGQSVTITPITNVPTEGQQDGTSASGGSFKPYALPLKPTANAPTQGYMSVKLSFNCDTAGFGNGRSISSIQFVDKSAGGTTNGCTITWNNIEGGSQKCAKVQIKNAAGPSQVSSQSCGQADPRTITPKFRSRSASAACSSPCYNVGWAVTGFAPGNYTVQWQVTDSKCNSGYQLARSFSVGSGGRASRIEGWFISGTCKTNGTAINWVRSDGVEGKSNMP